jgi:hypothetical protein
LIDRNKLKIFYNFSLPCIDKVARAAKNGPVPHISSHQAGITRKELQEAIPESLASKAVHLHWIDKSPAHNGEYTLTAKIEIDGQVLLLRSRTTDRTLIDDWEVEDPTYHTNARLVALERILTDPANEDMLLSL